MEGSLAVCDSVWGQSGALSHSVPVEMTGTGQQAPHKSSQSPVPVPLGPATSPQLTSAPRASGTQWDRAQSPMIDLEVAALCPGNQKKE